MYSYELGRNGSGHGVREGSPASYYVVSFRTKKIGHFFRFPKNLSLSLFENFYMVTMITNDYLNFLFEGNTVSQCRRISRSQICVLV